MCTLTPHQWAVITRSSTVWTTCLKWHSADTTSVIIWHPLPCAYSCPILDLYLHFWVLINLNIWMIRWLNEYVNTICLQYQGLRYCTICMVWVCLSGQACHQTSTKLNVEDNELTCMIMLWLVLNVCYVASMSINSLIIIFFTNINPLMIIIGPIICTWYQGGWCNLSIYIYIIYYPPYLLLVHTIRYMPVCGSLRRDPVRRRTN